MKIPSLRSHSRLRYAAASAAVAAAVALGGCGTPGSTDKSEALALEPACQQLVDGLFQGIPSVERYRLIAESKISAKPIVAAPLFELKSGDQNAAMQACDATMASRLASSQTMFAPRPFGPAEMGQASYAVVSASEVTGGTQGRTTMRLRAALVDVKSGKVLSRSSVVARVEGGARAPTPFFRDSPVLVRDEILESHDATLKASSGDQAHPRLAQDLRTRAQLVKPIDMYNRERYPEALGEFKAVAAGRQGDTLTSQVGVYVAGTRVGAQQDVAAAGDKIVEKGLEAKQLDFKIFFRPDSVTPYVTPPFDTMRLVVPVANKIGATRRCLIVVGHTSNTGSAAYNKALSLRRAEYIRDQMSRVNPAVRVKVAVEGHGFDDNIVGSGRDDDTDMADRRVEFQARDC